MKIELTKKEAKIFFNELKRIKKQTKHIYGDTRNTYVRSNISIYCERIEGSLELIDILLEKQKKNDRSK